MSIDFSIERWRELTETYRRWWAGELDRPIIAWTVGGQDPGRPEPDIPAHGFAAFYESLGRVDLTERHKDEKPFGISGTKVRSMLQAGERPDPRIMRPETSDVLIEAYSK